MPGVVALAAAETVRSFTIITTERNDLCAQLHSRMPVILDRTAWPLWLGQEPATSGGNPSRNPPHA
jgi:putative SOS response-associated peptidase YedK